MKKNVKIAKELVKLAKSLVADDKNKIQNEYDNLQKEARDKIQKKIDDFMKENFGVVNDEGYKITLVDYTFRIECGNKNIDEETVRQLIREGQALERYQELVNESYYNAFDDEEINQIMIKLADLSKQLNGGDYDEYYLREIMSYEEFKQIVQNRDLTPAQDVEIYKNGKHIKDLPWTRNMWNGGLWG